MKKQTNLKPKLELLTNPQAYFHELVTDTLSEKKISTKPETEFYLVNLLNQFVLTKNLFVQDASGQHKEEPLALMVKGAIEESNPEGQKLLFQRVGDFSLYISGFFQESIYRKPVNIDYYIEMGGAAYGNAANLSESQFKKIFEELSDRFSVFVHVLSTISEKTTQKTESNLLRIYELWLKTKSQKAEVSLKKAGIDPKLQKN